MKYKLSPSSLNLFKEGLMILIKYKNNTFIELYKKYINNEIINSVCE